MSSHISWIYRTWFILLIYKIVIAYYLPLVSDESYYWVWSQNLQWSYYDHPAMAAWLFKLGSPLQGVGHLVRLPFILIAHLNILIWDQIAKPYLNTSKRLWLLVLLSLSPMIGLGALVATPDIPLLFFWSLSLLCWQRVLQKKTLKWYIFLGISLGLGFCSKYHTVIFVPIVLLWIFISKNWLKIKWRHVPFTIIAGLLFCFPVLYWNYQNDFISFKFQIDHGLGAQKWLPQWTLNYILAQVFIIFPFFIWSSVKIFLKKDTLPSWINAFAWGPILFFLMTSFKGKVEDNWPMMAYPAFILIGAYYLSLRSLVLTLSTWVLLSIIILSQVFHPWIHKWFPSIQSENLKTYEPYKYEKLRTSLKKYQPFYSSTFQMASHIWYRNQSPQYKLHNMGRKDFFDFQEESIPKEKKFYVGIEGDLRLPAWILRGPYSTQVVKTFDSPSLKVIEVLYNEDKNL